MSVYPPPSFEEYLSVFNPSDWGAGSSTGLDIAYLDANYLKFPVAQGTETLQTANVVGNLTINNTNNKIRYNGAGSNILAVKSGSDVDLVATTLGSNNIVIGGGTTAGRLLANTNVATKLDNVVIGADALSNNVAVALSNISNNVAIGSQSMRVLRGSGGANITNTAVGTASFYNLDSGQNNFAGGYASGIELTLGNNNTFIGVSSGLNASLAGGCNNSTVIGYNAKNTTTSSVYLGGDSNQIILGVKTTGGAPIPVKFEDLATSTITNGVINQSIVLTATPTSWSRDYLGSVVSYSYSSAFQINLSSSLNAVYTGKPFWIHNNSGYTMTLNSTTGSFVGKYGTSGTGLVVSAGGRFGFYYNGTDYNAFDKDTGVLQLDTTTVSFAANGWNYLSKSVVRLNPTSAQTISFPQLTSATLNVPYTPIVLQNISAFTSTLSATTSIFAGIYGNQSASNLVIYPKTSLTLLPNPASLNYEIIDRVPAQITLAIAYTGTAINLDYGQIDSIINFTGSAATQINLPSPAIASNSYITGRYYRLYNNGSGILTLSTSGLTFTGVYGNNQATISLQDNTWYNLSSNGTTWDINERSSNITYTIPVSATVSYSTYYNLTDATVKFTQSSAGSWTITLPTPTASQVRSTTSRYFNTSIYTMTLSNSANILGQYGSGTATYILLPNSFVELFSDGTNYYAQERSTEWIYNQYLSPATAFTATNQYLDSTIELNPPDDTRAGSGTTFTGTSASQTGNVLTITTVSTGTLCAGSVITLTGGVRSIVYTQLTATVANTVGIAGTYLVSSTQTLSAVAYTGVSTGGQNITGTTTTLLFSSQTTNIPTTTVNTINVGSGSLGAGNPFYAVGDLTNIGYILNNANSGGVGAYQVSSAPTTTITTGRFFSTKAGQITIPTPSTSLYQRRLTVINNSYLPANIISVGAVFTGQFGQQASPALGTSPATNASQYLLMPNRTVVLECDGVNWYAITGTTIGNTKVFSTNAQATGLVDETLYNITTIYPSNCYDGGLNALQFSNNGLGDIVNTSNYPITLLVNLRCIWTTPAFASSAALPTRTLGITPSGLITGGALTNFTQPISKISSVIPLILSGANLVASVGTYTQDITKIIVLNYNDSFRCQIAKANGSGAVAETLQSAFITCQRLS